MADLYATYFISAMLSCTSFPCALSPLTDPLVQPNLVTLNVDGIDPTSRGYRVDATYPHTYPKSRLTAVSASCSS